MMRLIEFAEALSAAASRALVGGFLSIVLVNVLGGLLFSGRPSYNSAQGLETAFFLGSLFVGAPLGAIYWAAWSGEGATRRAHWRFHLGFLLLNVALTCLIAYIYV